MGGTAPATDSLIGFFRFFRGSVLFLCLVHKPAALLSRLMCGFMGGPVGSPLRLVLGILRGGIPLFLRLCVFHGFLCADIGTFHPLHARHGLVQCLYIFMNLACFDFFAHRPPSFGVNLPLLRNFFRHYHKPPVCSGILAGGERNQLVPVLCVHSRIIEGQCLALIHIRLKILLRFRIGE